MTKLTLPITFAVSLMLGVAQADDYRWNQGASGSFGSTSNWQVFDTGSSTWIAASTPPTATDNIVTPNLFGDLLITTNNTDTINNVNIDLTSSWNIFNPSSGSVARIFQIDGDFTKSGASTLTLRRNGGSSPGFTINIDGNLDVQEGAVIFGTSSLNVSSVTVDGTTTIGDGADLRIHSDTPSSFGAIEMTNSILSVNASNVSGGTVGGISASSISGSGTIQAKNFGTNASTGTLTLDGTTGTTTYSGTIQNGVGTGTTLAIEKTGGSTQVLSGANTYSGGTEVSGGNLYVNNSSGSGTGTGAVLVSEGLLGGTGSISGDVTIGDGAGASESALLAPGADGDIGVLEVGALDLDNDDAAFTFDFNSDLMTVDSVDISGTLTLGDGAAGFLGADLGSTLLDIGEQFELFTTTGGITGYFEGLTEGAIYNLGVNEFQISYGLDVTNSVTLTTVPEPSSAVMCLVGLAGLGYLRGRRRHSTQ